MNEPKHQPRNPSRHRRCEICGYDLHNNKSGQCPECGAASSGALRMPPQWWILIAALGLPSLVLLLWLGWSVVIRLGGGS